MYRYLSTERMSDMMQNLKFYNVASEYMWAFSSDMRSYLNSLPNPEFSLKIQVINNLYGSVMKLDDTIYILLYGVNSNIFNIIDCAFITLSWSFYGLESGVSETISRFYISLHYQLQSLLITYPSIKKIRIIGDSYGGGMSQVLGIIMYKILLHAKGTISSTGQTFIDNVYTQYIAPHLSSMIGEKKQDPILNELNSQMLLNPDASFVDNIKAIDKRLFSNIDLEQVLIFGSPNSLDVSILSDPDLNMQASIQNFDNGGTVTGDFFSRVYSLMSINDPVANIFSMSTFQGNLVYCLSKFRRRIIIGQLCALPNDPMIHGGVDYAIALYNTIINGQQLRMFSYNTVPNPYPFCFIRLGLIGLRLVRMSPTLINYTVVCIALVLAILIEIVLPALCFYGLYLLGVMIWRHFH